MSVVVPTLITSASGAMPAARASRAAAAGIAVPVTPPGPPLHALAPAVRPAPAADRPAAPTLPAARPATPPPGRSAVQLRAAARRAARRAALRARAVGETGPLVVATDGRAAALPAVRAAARLAAQLGTSAEALAVLAPVPTYGAVLDVGTLEALTRDCAAAMREAVAAQLQVALAPAAAPAAGTWPTHVACGSPARVIAERGRERGARLVVLGIGRHALRDRLFGTETALQVLRLGSCPVLAVGAAADGEFRRAVVAVDFESASVRAAALALALLAPGGTLSLVHVKARLERSAQAWEALDELHGQRVRELMTRLVTALRAGADAAAALAPDRHAGSAPGEPPLAGAPRRDVTIGTAVLVGDPADELLDYAERVGADLLAVGSHGAGFVERAFVGSVATDVLRGTSARLPACSVLACPEPPAAEACALERCVLGTTEALAPAEWKLALEGFAIRNHGRRVVLDVDDPALGAQVALRGLALLGATYDPRDARAELMFGDPADGRRHLTRTIPRVGSVAVLTGPDGRDEALRVEHGDGRGQTRLAFPSE